MPLTAEEVEQLRRIHVLAQFGELPAQMQALLEELRARDTGGEMIAPTLDVQVIPQPRDELDELDEEYADYDEYDDIPVVAAAAW